MTVSFDGKVALVTGAAGGMGLATARAFAEAGAAVALADVNEASVVLAAEQLAREGHSPIAIGCNVADEQQVEAMVARTVEALGRLDAAFNNAGVIIPQTDTADLSAEEFDRVIAINLRGVWLCMKYELQQMRKQGSGSIVNNSSLGGLVGAPGRSAYMASKHGVLGLTKSSALEYAAKGIHINAICPGTIETPMVESMVRSGDLSLADAVKLTPIGRTGRPEEIADAVLWLCSPASSFVIGHPLSVDGGYVAQ